LRCGQSHREALTVSKKRLSRAHLVSLIAQRAATMRTHCTAANRARIEAEQRKQVEQLRNQPHAQMARIAAYFRGGAK
jgi:hypothetical protein